MLQSPGRDNRPLSDLDQISAIMEGISTGDEAINFFARYGADTPVSAPCNRIRICLDL